MCNIKSSTNMLDQVILHAQNNDQRHIMLLRLLNHFNLLLGFDPFHHVASSIRCTLPLSLSVHTLPCVHTYCGYKGCLGFSSINTI